MGWLYNPENTRFGYNLPIHSQDDMLNGFTYRYIIDTCIANCGHNVTETQLKKHIKEELEMQIENMWENFELCKENMLKEIHKR